MSVESTPTITAIIANHNGAAHLANCLNHLEAIRSSDELPRLLQEIIVVDNASNDTSVELVRGRFPECRLLRLERNLGFGAANNAGAAEARGDHLLLINSDAWIDFDSLARLRSALNARPRTALAAPQLRFPDGTLQFGWVPDTGVVGEALQMLRNRFENHRWNHRILPRLLRLLHGPGWHSAACLLLRAPAFDQVGGFDDRIFMYFEDVDLSLRLRHAGWSQVSVPEAIAYHVKGGSATPASELEYRDAQLFFYRTHRPRWEYRFLARRLRRKLRDLDSGGREIGPELRRVLEGGP